MHLRAQSTRSGLDAKRLVQLIQERLRHQHRLEVLQFVDGAAAVGKRKQLVAHLGLLGGQRRLRIKGIGGRIATPQNDITEEGAHLRAQSVPSRLDAIRLVQLIQKRLGHQHRLEVLQFVDGAATVEKRKQFVAHLGLLSIQFFVGE